MLTLLRSYRWTWSVKEISTCFLYLRRYRHCQVLPASNRTNTKYPRRGIPIHSTIPFDIAPNHHHYHPSLSSSLSIATITIINMINIAILNIDDCSAENGHVVLLLRWRPIFITILFISRPAITQQMLPLCHSLQSTPACDQCWHHAMIPCCPACYCYSISKVPLLLVYRFTSWDVCIQYHYNPLYSPC